MLEPLKKIYNVFIDLAFPKSIYCIVCGNLIDKSRRYSLCDRCIEEINWNTDKSCKKCGKILSNEYKELYCKDCLEGTHYFEKGFSCVFYGAAEKELIKDFKYKGKRYYGYHLAEAMADKIKLEDIEFDYIVPIPMYRGKRRRRGYNQAEILAKYFSELLNGREKYKRKILIRNQDTVPMSSLSLEERKENLKNVFTVNEKYNKMINGSIIILLDDIYTTGTTIDMCSKALLEKGCKKIYFITFASGK